MMPFTEHNVADADDGIRLDRWFKRHYPGVPHGLLEKQLRKGLIRLDGKKVKSSDRISAGQAIRCPEIKIEPKKEKRVATAHETAEIKRWVLHKDANLIVINKPSGLAAQGGNKITRSVDGMLGALAEGGERPRLAHRLDRDTSGCLVLARTAKAAAALGKAFAGKGVQKTYLALVIGQPENLAGKIDLPILKKENPRADRKPGEDREYEIMMVDEAGQRAVTEYRAIDLLGGKFTLMELKPLTGRTHQLRVHMQALGCPIVGDHKYGGGTDAGESLGVENKLHLHAWHIAIPPLFGARRVAVTAPLPPHIKKSFDALGIDIPRN